MNDEYGVEIVETVVSRPYRACLFIAVISPGRCPGLICCSPSGWIAAQAGIQDFLNDLFTLASWDKLPHSLHQKSLDSRLRGNDESSRTTANASITRLLPVLRGTHGFPSVRVIAVWMIASFATTITLKTSTKVVIHLPTEHQHSRYGPSVLQPLPVGGCLLRLLPAHRGCTR
jgi:hypothetical protein